MLKNCWRHLDFFCRLINNVLICALLCQVTNRHTIAIINYLSLHRPRMAWSLHVGRLRAIHDSFLSYEVSVLDWVNALLQCSSRIAHWLMLQAWPWVWIAQDAAEFLHFLDLCDLDKFRSAWLLAHVNHAGISLLTSASRLTDILVDVVLEQSLRSKSTVVDVY